MTGILTMTSPLFLNKSQPMKRNIYNPDTKITNCPTCGSKCNQSIGGTTNYLSPLTHEGEAQALFDDGRMIKSEQVKAHYNDKFFEEKEIKEYLAGTYFDQGSGMFFSQDRNHVADMRGWGKIQNMFLSNDKSIDNDKAEEFQDALGKYIADAINQKLNQSNETI